MKASLLKGEAASIGDRSYAFTKCHSGQFVLVAFKNFEHFVFMKHFFFVAAFLFLTIGPEFSAKPMDRKRTFID